MADCGYNCASLSLQEQIDCNNYLLGGISSWAFIECDETFIDYSAAAEWQSKIAAGTVTLFLGVKGNIPNETPVLIPSRIACGSDIRIAADYTAVIMDSNITANNVINYRALNNTRGHVAFYLCDSDQLYVVMNAVVSFSVLGPLVPEENTDVQVMQIDMAWRNEGHELEAAPAGIFS